MTLRFQRRACCARLVLTLAFAESACARPGLVVVHDLVAELPAAELSGEPAVILFGTPAAEAHQERGFYRTGVEEAERFSWAGRHAQLRLDWTEIRQRMLVLDVSPVPGMRRQSLDVRMNGGHLAHLRFGSRTRFLISVPARLQKAGDNRVSLTFGQASDSPEAASRAARLHSLSVAGGEGQNLATLAEPGSLPVVDAVRTDGVPSLVQMSGLELRYALRVLPGAELRVAASLAGASRSRSQLSIAVEDAPGRRREL